MAESKQEKHSFKTDFVYGLIVVVPMALTIWIVLSVIELISGPVSVVFGRNIPRILSFFITLGLIFLVGLFARNFLGKAAINFIETFVTKIPIINIVYKSIKQVVDAVSFKQKALSAVLVEYPRKGVYALGWITNQCPVGIYDKEGNDCVSGLITVFMPTTPNPTSGYFLYLPKEDVTELDISVEESIKILMSAGVIEAGQKDTST